MHIDLAAPPGVSVPSDILGVAPAAPPGAGAFMWGVSIVLWFAFLVCLAAVARSGGHLAWAGVKPSAHGGGNAATELMFSGVGLIITGSAAAIMTAITALL